MKKIISILLLFFVSFSTFAQGTINKKVQTAKADVDERSLKGDILIDVFECDGDNGPYTGIDLRARKEASSDSLILMLKVKYEFESNEYFFVHPDSQAGFLDAMNMIHDKFVEWSEVAKKNKITDFKKPVPFDNNFIVYEYRVSYLKPQPRLMWADFIVNGKGRASIAIGFDERGGIGHYSDYDFYSADKIAHLIYIIQPDYVRTVYEQTKRRIAELQAAEQERSDLFQ